MCPPRLEAEFAGIRTSSHDDLDLSVSLRSRRADRLHFWVSYLLGEQLEQAADASINIQREGFPMWLTRDLDAARRHAQQRYSDDPTSLYGLVASSHAKNLAALGIDNTFQATKRIRVARWFNRRAQFIAVGACNDTADNGFSARVSNWTCRSSAGETICCGIAELGSRDPSAGGIHRRIPWRC